MKRLLPVIGILLTLFNSRLAAQSKPGPYQLKIAGYTFNTIVVTSVDKYNGNKLREDLYLFGGEADTIKIPRRIDRIRRFDISNPGKSTLEIDTVDYFVVQKVIDIIDRSILDSMINSEIQLFIGEKKMTFDEAHLETIQPDGKTSFTIDLQKKAIREGRQAYSEVSGLRAGGFFIIRTIWFFDSKGRRREIDCDIAWLLK